MITERDVVIQLGSDRWTKTEAGWYREFIVGPDKIVYHGIPDTTERKMLEEIKRLQEAIEHLHTPRPLDDWHEDIGSVLWWSFPISEPPFSGDPHDSDFPFEYDDPSVGWVPLPDCDKIQKRWDAIEKARKSNA